MFQGLVAHRSSCRWGVGRLPTDDEPSPLLRTYPLDLGPAALERDCDRTGIHQADLTGKLGNRRTADDSRSLRHRSRTEEVQHGVRNRPSATQIADRKSQAVVTHGGEHGLRYALPNATIHMHQPLGGAQGQASDIVIQANEIMRLKDTLNNIFVKHTGQEREVLERDTDRDIYFTPEQGVKYGLIDSVLGAAPNANGASKENGKA